MNLYGQVVRMDQCANGFFLVAVKIHMVETSNGQVMIMNAAHFAQIQQSVTSNNDNAIVIKFSVRFVYVFQDVFKQSSNCLMHHFLSGIPLYFYCCVESSDLYVYFIKE